MIEELLTSIPSVDEMPARIESLMLCAHDVQTRICDLSDEKAQHEEDAAEAAAEESNESKRKAKRLELLRDDLDYHDIKARIREQERIKVRLSERAARLRRELRLHVSSQLERSAF